MSTLSTLWHTYFSMWTFIRVFLHCYFIATLLYNSTNDISHSSRSSNEVSVIGYSCIRLGIRILVLQPQVFEVILVSLCPAVQSALSEVPLLLQLLQASVVAVSAHRRHPSLGEDGTWLEASSCSSRRSRARGGRARGGRGRQRRPRPGLKTCRVQAHLWRTNWDVTLHSVGQHHVCIPSVCLFCSPFSLSMSSSWEPDASPDSSSMVPCSCFSTSCCTGVVQLHHSVPQCVFTTVTHTHSVNTQRL